MEARLAVALALVVAAVVAARWLERRRPAPPTQGAYPVPAQLDRADFPRPEAPFLVVLFSSRTCDSCAPLAVRVAELESESVATCEAEEAEHADLHRRYGIDAVPTTLVADAEGVVKAGFVGTVSAADLRAALTDARQTG